MEHVKQGSGCVRIADAVMWRGSGADSISASLSILSDGGIELIILGGFVSHSHRRSVISIFIALCFTWNLALSFRSFF